MRSEVSEREKLYIEWLYYSVITGELEKARHTLELWAQTYSRDAGVRNDLGYVYFNFGQYEQALTEFEEARRLDPSSSRISSNYVNALLCLNRFNDAQTTARQLQTHGLDSPDLRNVMYFLAFLQKDVPRMDQQLAYAAGKPDIENWFLWSEADTAAYYGRLERSREFTRRAVESAENADQKESAATYVAASAFREALFGNVERAKQQAAAAMQIAKGRDVQYLAALGYAIAGDGAKAEALAEDMAKKGPKATVLQFKYLPAVRAQIALDNRDATKAIETLQSSSPYDLGSNGTAGAVSLSLHPVYVRGMAYLAAHRGSDATAEFQKILDHRGVVWNSPIGALAHLQLGRSYAMQGDTAKAKLAYQDFLTLWKDADPDIPILKEAKAEYAKL